MASGRLSKVKGKVVDIPTAPTIGTATSLPVEISIEFTAPSKGGPIRSYIAKSNPSNITATGSTSPINITGLAPLTSYTISVAGVNESGTGEYSSASASVVTGEAPPDRAVFMSGATFVSAASGVNTIDYITVSTTGNATDFGDLIAARYNGDGCGSATRGLYAGGFLSGGATTDDIEYITLATTGNGTSFGDLTLSRASLDSLSNGTYGIWVGGYSGADVNLLEYVTMATTGNATDFGDLFKTTFGGSSGAGSSTRGLIAGGAHAGGGSYNNEIQYITYASLGNATDFGDLSIPTVYVGAASSSTRFISAGGINTGGAAQNTMEYVTIATTGNATSFGALTVARTAGGCTSNKTRMVMGGGMNPSDWANYNIIDYVTIASTGNATDFGDLTQGRGVQTAATCGNHGGI